MKYSLTFLALTLATFTLALPHPDGVASAAAAMERRGGEGDPYAVNRGSLKADNAYMSNQDGSGYEHGQNGWKKQGPVTTEDGNPYGDNKDGSGYTHGGP